MKNIQTTRIVAILLSLGVGTALAKEEKDEGVAFASLPQAVQKTIQAQATAKGGTVGDVEKEDKNGKVSYEAEIVGKDGVKSEIEVAEDGSLSTAKADDHKEEKDGNDEENEDDDDDNDK